MSCHSYWKKESSSEKVILNLLVNAIEAMTRRGDGPRELRVSSQRVTEILDESMKERLTDKILPKVEWTHVLIGVHDSGPGLNRKILTVFSTPFIRPSLKAWAGSQSAVQLLKPTEDSSGQRQIFPEAPSFTSCCRLAKAQGHDENRRYGKIVVFPLAEFLSIQSRVDGF